MKCNAFGLERSRDFRVVRDLDSLCVVTVQNLEQIGLTLEYLSALYISHREQTYRSIVWHLFSKKKKKKKKKQHCAVAILTGALIWNSLISDLKQAQSLNDYRPQLYSS